MNEVRVGVKRIASAELADVGGEATSALNAMWVTVDGVEVAPDAVISSAVVNEFGPMKVIITIIASKYERWTSTTRGTHLFGS